MTKLSAIWENALKQGLGAAFWYDPDTGLHWGDSHYMIFHNEGLGRHNERGIFGWVHPDSRDEYDDPQHPEYDINFGTDFGYGANKANPQLQQEAVEEVENALGYPAYDIFWQKSAGHSYETDDLDNAAADSLGYDFPSREIPCNNCQMPVYHGEICGNCGTENMMWWTGNGQGLDTFKGKTIARTASWEEDKEFERLQELDKRWNTVYTLQPTSSWEEQFDEDLDPDIGGTSEMPNPTYELNGWKVYEMNSNEYPDHDALWIDRVNKTIVINYQGHHAPMFEEFGGLMQHGYSSSTAGHFRSRPSTTESFPAGWGWHGSPGTKEEKDVIKQVLKNHYGVPKLKDIYQPDENAEENYFEDEGDHEANVKKV